MKKLQVIFYILILFAFLACKKDNTSKNEIAPQLINHWRFVGFISTNSDTTFVLLHSDCDSCMSLFISRPNIYFTRSYLNGLKTTASTKSNKLILKPTMPDGFPEGEIESKFFMGVRNPNTWEIKNDSLFLTTTEYSDTLLFVSE